MQTQYSESNTARNIISVATSLMASGKTPADARSLANMVKFNDDLITRINALKQIDILDANTKAYLFGIQLTDNVLRVEPKINAIWTLVKTAGLIDDSALQPDIPDEIDGDDDINKVAADVLEKMLVR